MRREMAGSNQERKGDRDFQKGKKILKKIYDCVVGVVVILLKEVISKIKKRKKENGGQKILKRVC